MRSEIKHKNVNCDIVNGDVTITLYFHVWSGADGDQLPRPLKEIRCSHHHKCKKYGDGNCKIMSNLMDDYQKQYIRLSEGR